MATLEVPDFDHKTLWKRLRAGLWTVLCAFALGVFFKVITPPDWIVGFMGLVYFVALLVFVWPYFARRWNV